MKSCSRSLLLRVPLLVMLAAATLAHAQQTVRLAPGACVSGSVFSSGFDRAPLLSRGSGGAWPGEVTRTVLVGASSREYLLYIPSSYRPGHGAPLLVALHGAPGSAALAPLAADAVRDDWSSVAERGGFLVLAPIASGTYGGWSPGSDGPTLGAALDDVADAYAIDTSRMLLWGFSAGGHWGYDLALRNTDLFAGFGANGGVLQGYACDTRGAPACTDLLAATVPRLPIAIRVGRSDSLAAYARADRERLLAHGWDDSGLLDYAESAGGHEYSVAQLEQLWGHLCRFAVDP